MSKKPIMVGDAAAPYAAKKPAKAQAGDKAATGDQSHEAAFKKVADKIFAERKELRHKLAQ